jgi:L-iditol 2-dehydrogenase
VKAAAVCGTDIRMYRNGARGATPGNPLVLGHEVSGIVESAGPDVHGYSAGMPIAVAPNMGCGVCDQCVSGNTQMCATFRAFGINIPGGFAPFMLIPREAVSQGNLATIPEGADFVSAALVEPLACVYNAFQRIAIVPGDTVLVIGAGPIGLMHAKVALMAGAAKVFMNDLSAERLSLCRKVEPAIIALESAGLKERLSELTAGNGVTVCITAAPSAEAQVLALEVVGLNGRVMFFGGLPDGKSKVSLDTNLVHYKQITITGTSRQSLIQYRQTLALVASGRLVVKDLVTMKTPLDEIRASFEQVMQGKGLKNIIEFA